MPTARHPGLTRPAEVDTYVNGECHYFALALHRLAGLPLAYVANRRPDGGLAAGHVVARVGDGLVADAEGVWADTDLLAHWVAQEIAPTTPDDIVHHLGGRLSNHAERRIRRAQRVLEEDGYLERVRAAFASAPGSGPR